MRDKVDIINKVFDCLQCFVRELGKRFTGGGEGGTEVVPSCEQLSMHHRVVEIVQLCLLLFLQLRLVVRGVSRNPTLYPCSSRRKLTNGQPVQNRPQTSKLYM